MEKYSVRSLCTAKGSSFWSQYITHPVVNILSRYEITLLSLSLLLLVTGLIVGCGKGQSVAGKGSASSSTTTPALQLLNVSYDPTRELWASVNKVFSAKYEQAHGGAIKIRPSHAASGSQARAIIDGLEADVATLGLWPDVDAIRKKGLIKEGWEDRLPNRSLPYTTPLVFVVRKGNPKRIHDWPDLINGDVQVITPNPKTSGNGKFSLLAAWGSVTQRGGTAEAAREFVTKLYQRVPVLDTGARGATATFLQKGIGDVHLTFESEALLEVKEGKGEAEVVYPPLTITAEPYVAVVDTYVDRKGTRAAAEEYLQFLFSPEGQQIVADHNFRPYNTEVFAKNKAKFPEVKQFKALDLAKSWEEISKNFFADGGIYDSLAPRGAALQ